MYRIIMMREMQVVEKICEKLGATGNNFDHQLTLGGLVIPRGN